MKIKKFLNKVMQDTLAPIRERRKEYEQNLDYVYEVLKKGTEKAEQKAASTLDDVKRSMRINYFEDDQDLINAYKNRAEEPEGGRRKKKERGETFRSSGRHSKIISGGMQ